MSDDAAVVITMREERHGQLSSQERANKSFSSQFYLKSFYWYFSKSINV